MIEYIHHNRVTEIKVDNQSVFTDYYKNLKTGNIYRVVGVAINSTNAQNGQIMVQYIPYLGESREDYVRDLDEFLTKFERMI